MKPKLHSAMNNHLKPHKLNRQNLLILKTSTNQSWEQIFEKAGATTTNWKNTIPKKFIQSIEANFRSGHAPAYYAKELPTSQSNLRKVCNLAFGMSPSGCITIRLMIEAYQLLETPNQTIKVIALSLGFNDPSYFTRFFKKHSGICPEDYRIIFFQQE